MYNNMPRVLILYARGTNREMDLACAFEQAGATVVIEPLISLKENAKKWDN